MNVVLLFTDGNDHRFVALCRELDDYLNGIVGGEKQREQYNPYNTLEDIHDVALLLEDETPVACGGYKQYEPGVAEIKRVFTKQEHRNRGYGKTIMQALEQRAKQQGYTKLILETGEILRSAMALYLGLGFRVMDNYGPYVDLPESVCMEKNL